MIYADGLIGMVCAYTRTWPYFNYDYGIEIAYTRNRPVYNPELEVLQCNMPQSDIDNWHRPCI